MSWQFGRKLGSPLVNGHLVHLVHVEVFPSYCLHATIRRPASPFPVTLMSPMTPWVFNCRELDKTTDKRFTKGSGEPSDPTLGIRA